MSAASTLTLEGPVTSWTVPGMVARIADELASGTATVDFSRVTELDSSAIALVLEWRRKAEEAKARVTIVNVPDAMRNLARLYGVTDLIELESR